MQTEMTYEEFVHLRDKQQLPEQYRVMLTKEQLNAAFRAEEDRQRRLGYVNNSEPSHVPQSFITTNPDNEVI